MKEVFSWVWTTITSVWAWFVSLTADAKIQLCVLITLILTLIISIFFEFSKLRKRIKFLGFEILESDTPLNIKMDFSNNCRRVIRISSFYAVSIAGLKSHDNKFSVDIQEGESGSARTWFAKRISIDDVYCFVLTDSVNKPYIIYLYKGEFTNKWLARFHRLKDTLWTKIKSSLHRT